MAVGIQPNAGLLNNLAGQMAISLRDNCQKILGLWAYVNSGGVGQAGLEAMGFTADDALTFMSLVDQMATVAQVFQGTATQATNYSFASALTALTGPQ